jgi:hypothetical protein
LTGFS